MKGATVVISINASWNILNFRQGLISALKGEGYRVVALAPHDDYSARLAGLDVEFVPIEIDKRGVSPLRDLILLARYRKTLRSIAPDLYLGFTAKPNIYGSLAAGSLGIPVINNVSGLGTAFIRQGLLTRIVLLLYKLAFRRSATIFFQNRVDRDLFVNAGIARADQARLIAGSGVDLDRFRPADAKPDSGVFTFLFVGRLLWDKGVREFIEAARLVRRAHPDVRFKLLGFVDAANRTAVTRSELDSWLGEGLVEYLGAADDVRPHIADADCVVLPSYREGLPRSLLEAGAMEQPLIATDVPGCRDVVEHGVTGLLCPPRDAQALAEAMEAMVALPAPRRQEMGKLGRTKIAREFDQRLVFQAYLEAVEAALP